MIVAAMAGRAAGSMTKSGSDLRPVRLAPVTPEQFAAIRQKLGMTLAQIGEALGYEEGVRGQNAYLNAWRLETGFRRLSPAKTMRLAALVAGRGDDLNAWVSALSNKGGANE